MDRHDFWAPDHLKSEFRRGGFSDETLSGISATFPDSLKWGLWQFDPWAENDGLKAVPHKDEWNALLDACAEAVRKGHHRAALIPAAMTNIGRTQHQYARPMADGKRAPRWAVVIPVRGAYADLRTCLASLPRVGDYEVIIAWTSDDAPWGEDRHLESVIRSSGIADRISTRYKPGGASFAENCNYGAYTTRAPYILFLNSDTVVPPHVFGALDAAMDCGAAAVGPWGTNISGFQNFGIEPGSALEKLPLSARVRTTNAMLAAQHVGIQRPPIPRLVGFALAVRAHSFRAVGGFDTSFVNAYEDDDLSLRLAAAFGVDALAHAATLGVLHRGHASLDELGPGAVDKSLKEGASLFTARWGPLADAMYDWWKKAIGGK